MGFATAWLGKKALFPRLIMADPDAGTGIIVVIPAYGEGDIRATIDSLAGCNPPQCACEVIVVVNAPATAPESLISENEHTISVLKAWRDSHNSFFRLFVCDTGISEIPGWGVGYARKTGMDEAVRRFDIVDDPMGVIASLDTDCVVNKDYFTGLYDSLYLRAERKGCTISLWNRRNDEELPSEVISAALSYELSRRYMYFGFRYAGYPWCFNVYGSAMAFKADLYVKSGGMNKRGAGEDFWFMRKILPSGGFFHNPVSMVYASSRISMRVPFGTGRSIENLISSHEETSLCFEPEVFDELKALWKGAYSLYKKTPEDVSAFYTALSDRVKAFISSDKFNEKVAEVSKNSASVMTFSKRYFVCFDLLFAIRYINWVKERGKTNMSLSQLCIRLAQTAGFRIKATTTFSSVLSFYRDSEAWISYSPF
jgi:hypothetical protein